MSVMQSYAIVLVLLAIGILLAGFLFLRPLEYSPSTFTSGGAACGAPSYFGKAGLPGLAENADVILIGTAQQSSCTARAFTSAVTGPPGNPGLFETTEQRLPFVDTIIRVERIVAGPSVNEVTVTQVGGNCPYGENTLVTSVDSPFTQGVKYLLFLTEREDGAYSFSNCGGKLEIFQNGFGEEAVTCWSSDNPALSSDILGCENNLAPLAGFVSQLQS